MNRSVKASALTLAWFGLGIATRIPFRERLVTHADTWLFIDGMAHYDVSMGAPHFPGYILYVMSAKAVDLFLHDPLSSLLVLSLFCSGSFVAGSYWLGRELFNARTGIYCGLFALTGPMIWSYGTVGLSYMIEASLALWMAWACYRALGGDCGQVLISAFALGLTAGFRQDALLFLLPMWLYAIRRAGWLRILQGLTCLAVTVAAWLVPMMLLSGGAASYLATALQHMPTAVLPTSVFVNGLQALLGNGSRLAMALLLALGAGWLPLAWHLMRMIARRRDQEPGGQIMHMGRDLRMLLICWILPGSAFLVAIHTLQPGQCFAFMPAFLLLSATSLDAITRKVPMSLGAAIVILLLALNVWVWTGHPFDIALGALDDIAPAVVARSQRYTEFLHSGLDRKQNGVQAKLDVLSAERAVEPPVVCAGRWCPWVVHYVPECTLLDCTNPGGYRMVEKTRVVILSDSAELEIEGIDWGPLLFKGEVIGSVLTLPAGTMLSWSTPDHFVVDLGGEATMHSKLGRSERHL